MKVNKKNHKSWYFLQIDKHLVKEVNYKIIRNKRGDVITDSTLIKRTVKENYEQFYANKYNNLY